MKKLLLVAWGLGSLLSGSVNATQLIYTPVNPNFGGSYLNGSYLLANASAQNDHKSGGSGYVAPTALERMASSLESRLISQLFNDATNGQEGYLKTTDFEINVVNEDGVLLVHITDIVTGETTVIEVGGVIDESGIGG
ncbi:curli assembly protein CsgF [Shewanella eurypsychrophilus]|uniref:Curli production assembly/transport component CsgF n=1 Tax=Shewanella eurypsychrophilus TaxID=2593656 RepID=A0ABX6V7V3_9GAMM|nr:MULTISPECIES: curli assembly protein CsgF [Shewanella]QFU22351.1 curli production assembly protein CsgF [Shewanella sp. YLB-09]QPG57638.1 curli assembly protein CsgF [Shewanella eurypsychrophilus]